LSYGPTSVEGRFEEPMDFRSLLMVAGEASGDMHAARLASEMRRLRPDLSTFGMGGPELRAAGIEVLADSADISVVGISEAMKVLPRAREIFQQLVTEVESRDSGAAVLVDSPDFNLRLAKALKQRGRRVIYYISPQVWAWRKGRVRLISKVVDRMLVVLPFEVDFYRNYGIEATYVGHPLVDEVPRLDHVWDTDQSAAGPFTVALLPGSRRSEVESILPTLLQAARELGRHLEIRLKLIKASSLERSYLEPFVEARVSVGEFSLEKYQLTAGGQAQAFNYFLNLSYLDFDGYRDHSETRTGMVNAKLRYDIDETSDLSLIFNATDSPKADDPGALTRAEVRRDRRQASARNRLFAAGEEMDQQRLGLVYSKSFGERHELTVRNHYVWRDFDNRLPFLSGGSVDLERFFLGGGLQYAYTGDVIDRALRLVLGFDADAQLDDRRRYDNVFGERGRLTFDQDEDVTAYGAYLQGQLDLGWKLLLTAGVRLDWVTFDVDDGFLADGDDSGSRTFDEASPSVGLVWSPLAGLNLYGNFSTSFETPTTTEFANPAGGGLNPDLTSATAMNFELGAKGLLPGRLRYELAVFRVKVDSVENQGGSVIGTIGRSMRSLRAFRVTICVGRARDHYSDT